MKSHRAGVAKLKTQEKKRRKQLLEPSRLVSWKTRCSPAEGAVGTGGAEALQSSCIITTAVGFVNSHLSITSGAWRQGQGEKWLLSPLPGTCQAMLHRVLMVQTAPAEWRRAILQQGFLSQKTPRWPLAPRMGAFLPSRSLSSPALFVAPSSHLFVSWPLTDQCPWGRQSLSLSKQLGDKWWIN